MSLTPAATGAPAKGLVRRALLSVFNKDGLTDFATGLHGHDVEILASGGTAKALEAAGIPVTQVDALTGAKEILGGRVKTLHPKVHAGILADRRSEGHLAELRDNGYVTIDLVVCNLYPFVEQLAAGSNDAQLVEAIDIGGPTLVRAAAKNADGGVTVVCDPRDYAPVLAAVAADGSVPPQMRRRLRAKAFTHVAAYDIAIAGWAEAATTGTQSPGSPLPRTLPGFARHRDLRYGENPHQQAALYIRENATGGVALAEQLAGKELSYNNYLDLDAACRAAYAPGPEHRCAVLKHTNPCGLAVDASQAEAFRRALAGDPVSAFGSIIGFNQPLTAETADALRESKLFVECIVAPGFAVEARAALAKKKNLRLVAVPPGDPRPSLHAHRIGGGMLVQQVDPGVGDVSGWRCVTEMQLPDGWLAELRFAYDACFLLKSNAIAITKDRSLRGGGTGQMSRVDATRQAIEKAGDGVKGAFLGSDAFFPFDDCVRLAAASGIVAIAQPGGSKRDQESIDACNELGIAMVFTGERHFRH